MGQVKFRPLKRGDKIAIVAPARAVTPDEMMPFKYWAESLGLITVEGGHLYGKQNQFSGSDEERAADFIQAWTDPEICAVFCARGGYGSMRLLKHIPEETWISGSGKILVGFSDITTLHLALNNRGFETLHAPMPLNFSSNSAESQMGFDALQNVLFNRINELELSTNSILNKREFEGFLVGGNLSLLYAALGTPEQPETAGKILFIEDLDEYLYHVDRMIVSLDRAGLFRNLEALLVGSMSEMKDNPTPFGKSPTEIIAEHCSGYGFPVIFDIPSGHNPQNHCLILNAYTTFDGSKLLQTL